MWTLNVLARCLVTGEQLLRRCATRPRRRERSAASRGADDLVGDDACRDLPGPAHHASGTRKAPSQFVFFSLRNGVIAPSGQEFMCGPLSVEYRTIVSSAMPSLSSSSSICPTFLS